MPAGPTSLANSGYGAVFYIGTGSPIEYAAVAEIATLNKKNLTVPAIDCTHLLSPNATEEMIPGIIKPGTMEMTGNFTGDDSQLQFTTLAEGQTVFPFKFTAPMAKGAKVLTVLGYCFVTDTEDGPYEANKKIDFKATLQTTGLNTVTVA